MSASGSATSRKRTCDNSNVPVAKMKSSSHIETTIDHAAVVKGVTRKLRTYNPVVINRNLIKVIGGMYKDIKALPSGHLFVKCHNQEQLMRLLQCKDLGDQGGTNVEVSVELYKSIRRR